MVQGQGRQPIEDILGWCADTGWSSHRLGRSPASPRPADAAGPGTDTEIGSDSEIEIEIEIEIDLRDRPDARGRVGAPRDPARPRLRRWPRPDATKHPSVPVGLFMVHARHDPSPLDRFVRSGARSPG